jgi:hypothetical protein
MRRLLAMSVVAATWFLVSPDAAKACTCVANEGELAFPSLEQAAYTSDAVLIGRVMTHVVLPEPRPYDDANVAYIEVEVLDGIKGGVGSVVKVWDSGFGTSCTWDLRSLEEGATVAFALERNGTKHTEYQQFMKLDVPPDDYLLHGCGEYARRVASDADRGALARALKQATRNAVRRP